MITDKSARKREAKKARALRKLCSVQWTRTDLLQIFALGMEHRIRTSPYGAHIGQNYFSNHFHAGARNPAGSKLLRRFIRESGRGTHERHYQALTGRRYNHLNLGEEVREQA